MKDLRGPEGSNNAIRDLTWQDATTDRAAPWLSASSTGWSVASSTSCRSTRSAPSPRTPRSWCYDTRCWSSAAKSPGPASPGRTGQRSPPCRGSSRWSAGRHSLSPPTRSCVGIELSWGAGGHIRTEGRGAPASPRNRRAHRACGGRECHPCGATSTLTPGFRRGEHPAVTLSCLYRAFCRVVQHPTHLLQ